MKRNRIDLAVALRVRHRRMGYLVQVAGLGCAGQHNRIGWNLANGRLGAEPPPLTGSARDSRDQCAMGRNGANALPLRGIAPASSGQCRRMMLAMLLLAIQSSPSGE